MTEPDEDIIGGIFRRIKGWLCGYAVLAAIDAVVYTGLFWLIGVPYFPVFGIISGLSVLVPGIGMPVAALLTLGGCLVDAMIWWRLLLVVGVYVFYGAVIEQFIIYPALVGGVLGLTARESLIALVVGVCLGGLPGMLVALPAAGVGKFIWRWLMKRRGGF